MTTDGGRPLIDIVVARSPAARVAAALDWQATLAPATRAAVLVEALPATLAGLADTIVLAWLPPGCVCCTGAVPLRVTLDRLVRAQRPVRLLLLLSTAAHLAQVLSRLSGGGYTVASAPSTAVRT